MLFGKYNNFQKHVLCIIFVLVLLGTLQIQAQTYDFGHTPSAEDLGNWGPLVGPSGQELPPGKGTGFEGENIYQQKCAYCHGPTGAEPFMPSMRPKPWKPIDYCCFPAPLISDGSSLTTLIPVKSVGVYWTKATTIWDYINRAMPPDELSRSFAGYEFAKAVRAQGPLTPDEVYALTAYILSANKVIEKDFVLDHNTILNVDMPGRHIMIPEDPGSWYPKRQIDPHIAPNSHSLQ